MDERLASFEQLRRDLQAARCEIDNLLKSLASSQEGHKALLERNGALEEKLALFIANFPKVAGRQPAVVQSDFSEEVASTSQPGAEVADRIEQTELPEESETTEEQVH